MKFLIPGAGPFAAACVGAQLCAMLQTDKAGLWLKYFRHNRPKNVCGGRSWRFCPWQSRPGERA